MRGKKAAVVVGILGAGMVLRGGGWLPAGAIGAPLPAVWAAEQPGSAVHTPPPGSPERQAILDALRFMMHELHGMELIFVVRHLKVKGNWAWLEVEPRSPDGRSRFEGVCALLKYGPGHWEVAELASTEEDSPLWRPGYARSLKARFPGLPLEIFPASRR